MTDLTNPIFTDADKARKHLEKLYWPNGPVCRHCGNADPKRITKLVGKSTRPGVLWCNECDAPFTVTVGTVMEDSKIPLNKWVLAFHLMSASKKGMSAHQLHRMLGVTYKTAWFLAIVSARRWAIQSRTSRAARLAARTRLSRPTKPLSAAKRRTAPSAIPHPRRPFSRSLNAMAAPVLSTSPTLTRRTLRPAVMKNTSRKSTLMTDEASYYVKMGREFADHKAVDHSRNEYAYKLDGRTVSTNNAENYFSIFKRGVVGTYHSISEAHLSRYLAEFDFRYSNRSKLGVEDTERTAKAIKGAEGKRLTYHQPR